MFLEEKAHKRYRDEFLSSDIITQVPNPLCMTCGVMWLFFILFGLFFNIDSIILICWTFTNGHSGWESFLHKTCLAPLFKYSIFKTSLLQSLANPIICLFCFTALFCFLLCVLKVTFLLTTGCVCMVVRGMSEFVMYRRRKSIPLNHVVFSR